MTNNIDPLTVLATDADVAGWMNEASEFSMLSMFEDSPSFSKFHAAISRFSARPYMCTHIDYMLLWQCYFNQYFNLSSMLSFMSDIRLGLVMLEHPKFEGLACWPRLGGERFGGHELFPVASVGVLKIVREWSQKCPKFLHHETVDFCGILIHSLLTLLTTWIYLNDIFHVNVSSVK